MCEQSVYLDLERSVRAAETYSVHRWMTGVVDKSTQLMVYAVVYRCAELGGPYVGGSKLIADSTMLALRTVQQVTREMVRSGVLVSLEADPDAAGVHGLTKRLTVNMDLVPDSAPFNASGAQNSASHAQNVSEFSASHAQNDASHALNGFNASGAQNSALHAQNVSEFSASHAQNDASHALNGFNASGAQNSASHAQNDASDAQNPLYIDIGSRYVVDRLVGWMDNQPTVQPERTGEELQVDAAGVEGYRRLTAMTVNRNRIDDTWGPYAALLASGLTGEEICAAWMARQRRAREDGADDRFMPQLRKWLVGDPIAGSAAADVAAARRSAEQVVRPAFHLLRTAENWIVVSGGGQEIVTGSDGRALPPDTPREQVEALVEGRAGR